MHVRLSVLAFFSLLSMSCGGGEAEEGGSDKPQPVPSFVVSSTSVETACAATTIKIDVEAGCEWSLSSGKPASWLTLSKSAGSITLTFVENTAEEDRGTSFEVMPQDTRLQSVPVQVLQCGIPAGLDRNGIICALAWSLMTDAAKVRITALYPDGLASVAPALEGFLSTDKYNAYVPGLHKMAMNNAYLYDPNTTQAHGGDCLRGLRFADYYLRHLSRFSLPDEEKYFYHSLLVSMVEDIHDLSLPAMVPAGTRWTLADGSDRMDAVCKDVFGGLSIGGVLRKLTDLSASDAAELTDKPFEEWAQETCAAVAGTGKDPQGAVRKAVRDAGYRLAALFNTYYK